MGSKAFGRKQGCGKYRGADKSLAQPGGKKSSEARFQQHRDASYYQVFFFLQSKAPKEIHVILTETLACFLPGPAKDLSAPRGVGGGVPAKEMSKALFIESDRLRTANGILRTKKKGNCKIRNGCSKRN